MKDRCHICKKETMFLMKKDEHPLFKCDSCGLVYMNPLPEQNFLNKEVYSHESGYQANKPQDLSKTIPTRKTKDILSFLDKNVETNNIKRKILDVGCSNGEFMYNAKQMGFDPYGVELNDRTANIAIKNGLNIHKGLLSDAKYPNDFFDIIFLGDVIEHVLSPRDFISECRRIIKTNGVVIISTPNLDCLWSKVTFGFYKIFQIPWSSVTPPYHTFQFSINNLDMLLNEFNFTKINTWFYRPPRLMYELGSLHLLKKYKQQKTISNLFFMIFSFAIYTTTYILVIGTRFLRKKDFSMISIYKKHV